MRGFILKVLRKIDRFFFKRKTVDLPGADHATAVMRKTGGARIIGDENKISIGEYVSFGGDVILYANETISIGNHVMIALNVIFHTSTHDYNNHPMWLERIDAPIKIGNHVWIGAAAIILPGVIIEDYAVIGAGAVISSNVPKGAVVAGNPARIIKYRDIEKIENSVVNNSLYPGKIRKREFKKTHIKSI